MKRRGIFLLMLTCMFCAVSVAAADSNTGMISGKLQISDGRPMTGGVVIFFDEKTGPPPSPDRYWRVPDSIHFLDEEGGFSVELPEGRYYIAAVKRVREKQVGPPGEGDYFLIIQDEEGKQKIHVVNNGGSTALGTISSAVPFHRGDAKDITGIEGTVLSLDGEPIAGAVVSAHMTPTMLGLPLFVSDRTGKDGRYLLGVHEGGQYYIKVRGTYGGGPPSEGDIIGSYGDEGPVPVTVKRGEVTGGITITAKEFAGRGPKQRKKSNLSSISGIIQDEEE